MYSLLHCPINTFASVSVVNIPRLSNSSLILPLNDSIYPFPRGLPGSMNNVFTPIRFSHLLTALAVNSGPLSDLTCFGIPLNMISSNSWSMTSCEVMRRFTSIARHSLEYSSIILSMRNGLLALGRELLKRPCSWLQRSVAIGKLSVHCIHLPPVIVARSRGLVHGGGEWW